MKLFPLILIPCLLASNPDHWQTQIMWGEIGAAFWLYFKIGEDLHWSCALSFLYFASYAIFSQYSTASFVSPTPGLQEIFNQETARSVAFLMFAAVPFILSATDELENWLTGFQLFALVNSALMIFNFFYKHTALGLIGMDSVDGTFLAIILPSLVFAKCSSMRQKTYVLLPVLLAVVLSRSSTVFGIIVLEALVLTFLTLKNSITKFAILAGGAAFALPLGHIYLGGEVFNPNGRLTILLQAYDVFAPLGQWLFGLGTSAFIVIMPLMQDPHYPQFVWLHNEPLQIVFEQGLVGLALIITMYLYMLKNTFKNPSLFLMVVAAGFASFFQPFFRYFPFALFLVFLTRLSFASRNFNKNEKGELYV